jgi:TolB protein
VIRLVRPLALATIACLALLGSGGHGLAEPSRLAAGIVWTTPSGVYEANTDGSGARALTRGQHVDQHLSPAWSPAGDALAYSACASDECTIEIYDAASRRSRTLRVREPYPRASNRSSWLRGQVAWSPDGKELAYRDGWSTGVGLIQIVAVDSGRSRPLTRARDDRWDGAPAWSPNGRLIAFVRRSHRFAGVTLHGPPWIYVVEPDGDNLRRLTSGHTPSWAPDGRQLVFAWGDGIYRIEADGRSRTRIAVVERTRGDEIEPKWSPDGRRILYRRAEHGGASIWSMNVDGSDSRRLVLVRNGQPLGYAVSGLGWRPG